MSQTEELLSVKQMLRWDFLCAEVIQNVIIAAFKQNYLYDFI